MPVALTWFQSFASTITQGIALTIDFIALFVIVAATLRSISKLVAAGVHHVLTRELLERIRSELGYGLVLGLEFLIGADILRTAVAPTWSSIGQLGAIILLRTLLDYFLERELQDIPFSRNRRQPPPSDDKTI
ncbi:MAG TPA: DUF1622 domain-containing protein [Armatimonadota bacterium]|nr:DUF1622 domain-containing protein [Armatimonadota bacterium]